jgi:hypothetical protein
MLYVGKLYLCTFRVGDLLATVYALSLSFFKHKKITKVLILRGDDNSLESAQNLFPHSNMTLSQHFSSRAVINANNRVELLMRQNSNLCRNRFFPFSSSLSLSLSTFLFFLIL